MLRLGDILVQRKMITQTQLDTALEDQLATHKRLGDVLVELDYLNKEQIDKAHEMYMNEYYGKKH